MKTANIQEVFKSIQGEGRLVGFQTLFIRFSECNLRCDYCDTKTSWQKVNSCLIYDTHLPNDILVADLAAVIRECNVDYISLTGGEPLLQADFIIDLINQTTEKKFLLETNGTLPLELNRLKEFIDIFSVDIKLNYLKQEKENMRKFIQELIDKDCYFKIVISTDTPKEQLLEAVALLPLSAEIFLQPAEKTKPDYLSFIEILSVLGYKNVRFVPQIHKLLAIR